MDGLFSEISQAAAAMGLDGGGGGQAPPSGFNPYAAETNPNRPGGPGGERPSDAYTDAELMQIY